MSTSRVTRGAIGPIRRLFAVLIATIGAVLIAVIIGRTPQVHGRTPHSNPQTDKLGQPGAPASGSAMPAPDGAARARVSTREFRITLTVMILLAVFAGPLGQLGVHVVDWLLDLVWAGVCVSAERAASMIAY
jgi:hypothetical protein